MFQKSKQRKKESILVNVLSVTAGATIASGIFLLPGVAFVKIRGILALSYLNAALPVIPAVPRLAELPTVIPRARGI